MRDILYHDVEAGVAVIQFSHAGVVHTDRYELAMLVPGTLKVFADLNLPYDEAAQLRSIDYLQKNMEALMEAGAVPNDPEGSPLPTFVPLAPREVPVELYVQREPPAPVEVHESVVPMPLPEEEEVTDDPAVDGGD